MRRTRMSEAQSKMSKAIIRLLVVYKRWLSPLLPRACRFTPTCAEYAAQAIAHHGVLRGGALAAWRVLRCNPFCAGRFDPVRTEADQAGTRYSVVATRYYSR